MIPIIPEPLLDTAGLVDSLTLERAAFKRRFFIWKEMERHFIARYSWNEDGLLTSREEDGEVHLYAYDDRGNRIACYRLNASGDVTGREMWEWDSRSRLQRRLLKTVEPPAEAIWTYEHDEAGRMKAERRGNRVRVEKLDREGRIEQVYLYDGEKPDLVTDYSYDDSNRLVSIIIKDPDGSRHRRTLYTYDEEGRVASETISDSEDRVIKDEVYAYGATHGKRWLEQVTWIPDGKRHGKRRPREVVYRSFTYSGIQSRSTSVTQQSIAFANGVYNGPVLGEKPEGNGVFQYNDSSRYEGEFRNGVMEGFGRLSWPDGRVMEGVFSRGLLEGNGRCIWADGSRYIGEFRNGRMHGPGVFTWADGTRFEGLFEKGRRTDQGAWERPGDS